MSASFVMVVFFLVVLACLALFLVLLLGTEHGYGPRRSEIGDTIAGLSSANVRDFDMLFDDRDYSMLRAEPGLKAVCVKYRRERRRIALLWLGGLQKDVRLVWEFRRFLVRNGLRVTFREEATIALAGCFALLYLAAMHGVVFTCGPFVLARTIRAARVPVERLSSQGAGLLARAPAPMRAQLRQRWSQHVLAWNAA